MEIKKLLFVFALVAHSAFGQFGLKTPANQVFPVRTDATAFVQYATAKAHQSYPAQTNTVAIWPFPAGWGNGGSEGVLMAQDGFAYTSEISGSFMYRFDPATNSTVRMPISASGFLQGPMAPNGKFYYPGFSRNSIAVFDPSNSDYYEIGVGAFSGSNYYNGGTLGGDGNLWFAPGKGTNGFLKIVPGSAPGSRTGDSFSFVGSSPSMVGITTSYFACMLTASDGNMYAIPFDGHEIYRVTTGGVITQPFPTVTGTGAGSYASGVEESQHPGIIICMAYGGGSKILKINILTNTWVLLGTQTGGYGGCTEGLDFKIGCAPQHSTTVGIFDPETDLLDESVVVPGIANNDVIGIANLWDGRWICASNAGGYWLTIRSAISTRVNDYQTLYLSTHKY